MARIGLGRMLKHKIIEEILYPPKKKKPSHKNNLEALEATFGN